MNLAFVTDCFGIQVNAVKKIILSDEFLDRSTVATFVLNPALTALRYYDGMKGGTLALLYSLALQLDKEGEREPNAGEREPKVLALPLRERENHRQRQRKEI